MKVALISPNRAHLEEMSGVLRGLGHTAVAVEGGKSRMLSVAESERPDLMLTDGMCCDPAELGHVEEVTTRFPSIAVVLLCSTHTPEFLINSMRAGVREVLPSPASPEALVAAVNRVGAKLAGTAHGRAAKVLAFMSCKGGSGATFLAANLGYQLGESKSVLLIDLNLQFGDALSFVHEERPVATLATVAHDIGRLDASFLAASAMKVGRGFAVLAAPEDPAQAIEIKPEHVDAILEAALPQYDFILLDMPRNLDTLSIKALDRASRIFPVLQTGLPYIRNAAKLLKVFRSLGYADDKIELIVNRYEKAADIGLDSIRRTLATSRLHTVPNSYKEVSASINQGGPLATLARSNTVTRNLAEFALALDPKSEERRGLLGRMFRRA